MARFHVNSSGDAGPCRAVKGGCPFGDDEAHYASLDSARDGYERVMSESAFSPAPKLLSKDIFISVLRSNRDVLTERFGDDLGHLEPGEYMAQYYDEKTKEDKYIKLSVEDDFSVNYEDSLQFQSLSSATSKKTLDAFSEAEEAYQNLNTDPIFCVSNAIDRITLLESSRAFERVLAQYDLTKAEDAMLARQKLEDLDEKLDYDLEHAERDDRLEEKKALESAKAPLVKLLAEFVR